MPESRHHIELPEQTIVFSAGDVGDDAYYVESGYIDIVAADEDGRIIATRGPGDIFGEMALIDGAPRSATARTKTRCRLTRLASKAIKREFERVDPVMRAIVATILTRLREQSCSSQPGDLHEDDNTDRQVAMLSAITALRAERELTDAIERREIGLFYQPIIELSSGQIVGFEGLARWHHPEKGTLSPAHFIELAERTGQIGQITDHCLAEAVSALPEFHAIATRSGMRLPYININVSGQDLVTEDFSSKLERLTAHGTASKHLRLEITESALIDDPDVALRTLNACRAMGLGIAIDDFGTGYSNLSYLHQLPIDVLKIDRSFVQSMKTSVQSSKIIGSIVKLAESLELPTVCEGLESWDEVGAVAEFGCEYGQGFYFAKPMALTAIPRLLNEWDAIIEQDMRKIA